MPDRSNIYQALAFYGAPLVDVRPVRSLAMEEVSRSLPLVQVHVLDSLSLDGYATVGWDLPTGTLHEQYLGGVTWTF